MSALVGTAPLKALRREKGRDGFNSDVEHSERLHLTAYRAEMQRIRELIEADRLAVGGKRIRRFKKTGYFAVDEFAVGNRLFHV